MATASIPPHSRAAAGHAQNEADAAGFRLLPRLAISVFFLLGAMGLWLLQWQGSVQDAQRTVQAYETRNAIAEVLRLLVDAETGQRGYLLSGREAYLRVYQQGVAQMPAQLNGLEALLSPQSGQMRHFRQLRALSERKLAELDATVRLFRAGRRADALQLFNSNSGLLLMQQIRLEASTLLHAQAGLLASGKSDVRNAARFLTVTIVGCFIAALLTISFTAIILWRQLRQIGASRSALETMNRELEERVAARTADLQDALLSTQVQKDAAEFERKRVESLLRELNHRVGNNLAMVSALLGLQLARAKSADARQAIEGARTRLQTISSAQRRLRLDNDLQMSSVKDLFIAVVEDLISAMAARPPVKLAFSIEDVDVPTRDATTCAILIGELVTNAFRHAFIDGAPGTLEIAFGPLEGGGAMLRVTNSLPNSVAPSAATSQGLGSVILDRLARQYQGTVERASPEEGIYVVTIRLPKLQVKATANPDISRVDTKN